MRRRDRERPVLVHVTTSDMSLDWLLGPQLRAFDSAGYEVVGMSAPGEHVAALEASGVRHVSIPGLTRSSSMGSDLRALVQLTRALRRERPDVVHTHNPKSGVLGRIAARLSGVPLVVNTQHGLYALPGDSRPKRWAVYGLERVAAAFSHVELVQNPEDADTIVERLRVPARRVHVLGNGIDLARFTRSADTDRRRSVRAEWGVGDDTVVLGVVARLVAEKGIREIIEAAVAVRAVEPRARFVVVGPLDDAKADGISTAEVDAAVEAGVLFVGPRNDMPAVYEAFDVFVTASWREGIPRAAMEAAAMGLPTVATDVRGNRQVVSHSVTGLMVPSRRPAALAEACLRLVAEPDLRRAMGERAARRARTEFDQHAVIAASLQTYTTGRPPVPWGRSAHPALRSGRPGTRLANAPT
jgi:glycosyltransferase involved in cell wall biosynthesis